MSVDPSAELETADPSATAGPPVVDPVSEALDLAERMAADACELAAQLTAEELARVAPVVAELAHASAAVASALDLLAADRLPYTKPAIAVQDAGHAASPPGRARRRP